jgi:hypothetical protein
MLLPVLLCATKALAQAGPPFQTDDPVPVDYGHYEFYVFGGVDGTPAELDSSGPAFEFNWGALPRLQLHAILPWGTVNPTNNPVYAPGGVGPSAVGLTDTELGAKIAWIKERKDRPQIGTFTMFEMPTGNYSEGLGVGRVWYKLPVWAYKQIGTWGVDGGAGYTIVHPIGYRSFPYGGFLVQKNVNARLDASIEVFSHAGEGFATAQTEASTLIDAGFAYHFTIPGLQLLLAYATPSPARLKTTPTSACTRPGGRTKEPTTKPQPISCHTEDQGSTQPQSRFQNYRMQTLRRPAKLPRTAIRPRVILWSGANPRGAKRTSSKQMQES